MQKNIHMGTINLLKRMKGKAGDLHALIGFDGFVDEVVHVVKERINTEEYIREETLADYGNRIAKTGGYSSNVEIVTCSTKLGGNGPILANALIGCGVKVNYAGAVGYPNIHPVFEDMAENCESIFPLCNPSATDAVEFNDGKIIRCKLSAFNALDFSAVKERMGLDSLVSLMDKCELISFVNWALVPYSGDIWQSIFDEVLPLLSKPTKDKILFFDFADPASRPKRDLVRSLETIKSYCEHYQVVLGLNTSEAVQIANALGYRFEKREDNLKELCEAITSHIPLDTLVIHPVKKACCMIKGEYYEVEGPYCEKPILTTGAGDNFNAGFIFGKLIGMKDEECLLTGVAYSGYYVRNAKSPNIDELIDFISVWKDGDIYKENKI